MATRKQSAKKEQEHDSSGKEDAGIMKPSPYQEILKSQPFKFVVGETKEEFFLHSGLVASKSEALGKMINGPFIERQQGYVVLENDDARTVAAFAEFVYTGDYQIASEMSPRSSKKPKIHQRPDDIGHSCSIWNKPHNDHWQKFIQANEYGFQRPMCTDCGTEAALFDRIAPVLNTGSMETDFTEFFIAHVKVFLFADCYGVAELLELSIRKLHQALCGFRLSKARVGDVLALVRFCYERPCPDRLKKLLASYSAAIMDIQVSRDVAKSFQELLKEREDFGADVAWFLACRLTGSTEC
ncbi:hypothetical protein E4U09_005514 [Claviceps aff. purpurea]|uniref:BTB domain-containing protein n=1 Tax=Claviceps aff. purpurea TaxID=1967640 RepID=A0A9P7QBR1_9HYPO|nr:hypothetical protein E4U09_005514 [Claviceps aff. purpurea]